jgi:hypothetical protein
MLSSAETGDREMKMTQSKAVGEDSFALRLRAGQFDASTTYRMIRDSKQQSAAAYEEYDLQRTSEPVDFCWSGSYSWTER